MATGFMAVEISRKLKRHCTLLGALSLSLPISVLAQDVGLAGIMGSKAMLMINGGEPRAVAVGQTIDGVRLISVAGDQVIVEVDGKKRPLRVGQHAVGSAGAAGSG